MDMQQCKLTHLAAKLGVKTAQTNLSTASEAVGGRVGAEVGATQSAAKHEFLFVDSVVSGHGFGLVSVR